jgi:hypothetical protein
VAVGNGQGFRGADVFCACRLFPALFDGLPNDRRLVGSPRFEQGIDYIGHSPSDPFDTLGIVEAAAFALLKICFGKRIMQHRRACREPWLERVSN